MLTLDLDNTSKNKLKSKAMLLKAMFPSLSTVEYRMSSGGNGGHIRVLNITANEDDIFMIRRIMGDDIRRINKDIQRAKYNLPSQVLFDRKIKNGEIKYASTWNEVI